MELVVVVAILGFAGWVQGAVGFGFSLVGLALLGNLLPFQTAAVLMPLSNVVLNVFILAMVWRHFSWERIRWFFVASLAAAPLGVIFLKSAPPVWLHLTFALILAVSASQRLMASRTPAARWHPVLAGLPLGALSGALNGAFGAGGAPAVAYVGAQGFARLHASAVLQAVFAAGTTVRLATLEREEMLTPDLLALSAWGIPAALLGAYLGHRTSRHAAESTMALVTSLFMLVMAAVYALKGAAALAG